MLISEVYLREARVKVILKDQNCLKSFLLPLSVNVLDEAVGDAVPGESLVGWLPEHWVETKVGGRVDHWHGRLVPIDVVPLAERVHDVQLDVREGGDGVEDEGLELLVAAQVFSHRADTLPIVHHVFAQEELDHLRIWKCNFNLKQRYTSFFTSVHIPDLICALNNETRAVKLLGPVPVEPLLLPQAGVVVLGQDANELPEGEGEGDQGEQEGDQHLRSC